MKTFTKAFASNTQEGSHQSLRTILYLMLSTIVLIEKSNNNVNQEFSPHCHGMWTFIGKLKLIDILFLRGIWYMGFSTPTPLLFNTPVTDMKPMWDTSHFDRKLKRGEKVFLLIMMRNRDYHSPLPLCI